MTDPDGVRTIEQGTPPARFARGWHCLGLADRFRDLGPHAVEAFGTKLVVFADTGGDLHILDAYCRHMGGDLSRGSLKDDALACPFHDWRWTAQVVASWHRIPSEFLGWPVRASGPAAARMGCSSSGTIPKARPPTIR